MNCNVVESVTVFQDSESFRTVTDTPALEIREEGGKYGMTNSKGKTVVPFQYHNIYPIGAGTVVLVRYGKCGILRILWDKVNRRYHFKQTVKCEYDSIELGNSRTVLLRKRGRYVWYAMQRGTTSGEFRQVRILGERFVQGMESDYEKSVLCDCETGRTYLGEEEISYRYIGRQGSADCLIGIDREGKMRAEWYTDGEEVYRSGKYDILSPLLQTEEERTPVLRALYAQEGEDGILLDEKGREIWRGSKETALRMEIRGQKRILHAEEVWEQAERSREYRKYSYKNRGEWVRNALASSASVPPMRAYGRENPRRAPVVGRRNLRAERLMEAIRQARRAQAEAEGSIREQKEQKEQNAQTEEFEGETKA